MRSDGLTFIVQCEKLGSRQVLGGQAGWHPGLLTSGKDTFPVTMLLHLTISRDPCWGQTEPGLGLWAL